MVMKKITGYGAVTYKSVDGVYLTGRFGQEVDIDAEDVKRLDKLGAFEDNSSEALRQANVDADQKSAPARNTRKS